MYRSAVADVVNAALAEIEDERIRDLVRCKLIEPSRQQRQFEWVSSTSEEETSYESWLVASIGSRDVGIAFVEDGGFADDGYPWGLVFITDDATGSSNNWYKSLADCVTDSGYFD